MSNSQKTDNSKPTLRLAASRKLTVDEIELLELYQRQDSLSTQLWLQFLIANAAVVAVIVLLGTTFGEVPTPGISCMPLSRALSGFVLIVWLTFTIGGLSALRNSQDILLSIAHQIDGDVGDKTGLFPRVTRSKRGITVFHLLVDFGVLGLSVLFLSGAKISGC